MTSVLVRDAATIVPFEGSGPRRSHGMGAPQVLEGASVYCEDDRIVSLGDERDAAITIDASGCTVVPGFVDPHTHLPFYGWRADEDAARLSGQRYEQLHRGEGGIYRSMRMLAGASDDDVVAFSVDLARAMLRAGTTTFEAKSGYGLSVGAELRQLRLGRRVGELVPQTVVTTCLAAHAVPPGKSPGEWVGEAATDLLPAVAEEGLARFCDVYVESIAFALEHAARLSESATSLGLGMRMHADQLEDGQSGSFAARWGFASADHLNHTSLDAVADLAEGDTAAVLLPGATFTLRQARKPPARSLIEAGAIVALGTDLNPGTSPIHSIPFVMVLACRLYGLRPMEALAAGTVNAAFTLGLDNEVGRLVPGHRADIVVLETPSIETLPYRPDHNPVAAVICNGTIAHVTPDFERRITRS